MPVVGLVSDFGIKDHYVGVMKARILRECPSAQLIDISHQVLPQSISEGAYYLRQSVSNFPPGTIFLCVVDPGVGSQRKAVAVKAGEYLFVAPDNGLVAGVVVSLGGVDEGVELAVPQGASHTFHGRDVFAPAAGKLASGTPLTALGTPITELVAEPRGSTIFKSDGIEVTVLTVDHFGNIILDFSREVGWEPLQTGRSFKISGREVMFAATYSRVLLGQSLLLWNSSGLLELAVRNGNAASEWPLSVGDKVKIEPFGRRG